MLQKNVAVKIEKCISPEITEEKKTDLTPEKEENPDNIAEPVKEQE